ncbi:hypothetical protein R2E40_09985 [Aeromonas sp. CD]|uniref:DUF6950 family protein n=1 Tax=Aeromonas sp. CD TaxID=3080830 RepID=UPI00296731BB|nr:hypothetical protein [Aeromonas sp. CD]WOX54417.1 hypothetical protein R2E40_09985 [Aeromonas sp. CD]
MSANITEQTSQLTRYLAALSQLKAMQFDQYRATAFVMDAVYGTNDLEKLTYKTLRGAKTNLKKAFGVSSLYEYIESKRLSRIEPELAALGDIVLVLDEHDDIAFCAGKQWLYFDDADLLRHDRFSVRDYEVEMLAYRLTE